MNAAEIYLNKIANALTFNPIGAHGGGTTFAISAATIIPHPEGATKLLLQAFTKNLRYTLDGSDPSATRGFQLVAAADPIIIPFGDRTEITVIQESATGEIQFQWGI